MAKALAFLEHQYPDAAALVREAEEDVLAHPSFQGEHWRQIRSTNPLERLNEEIRRRTDVVGIFPNAKSALRLIGMVLVEQNDEWAVGRRHFSLESMALLKAPQPASMIEAAWRRGRLSEAWTTLRVAYTSDSAAPAARKAWRTMTSYTT